MNKTDEELNLAEAMAKRYGVRMCDENGDAHGEELYCVGIDDIADIIREALADHIADAGKVIAEPEYYDCGGTIGVVHKSQCSAAMKRNGEPLLKGFRPHIERMAELDANTDKKEAIDAARQRLKEKQYPVAHYKDAPHTIYLQTGCDDPEDCECSFNELGDTTWCADQIHDTDIPYIRADYAAPVQPVKQEPVAVVKKSLTTELVTDALTSILKMDVKGYELQERLQFSTAGRQLLEKAKNALSAPVEPVKQEPIGFIDVGDLRELSNGNERQYSLFASDRGRMVAIYAAPIDKE